MKILVVEPNRKPRVAEIDDTLEAKQEVVGGSIQMIFPLMHSDDACLICNEEGKYNGSCPNRPLRLEDGRIYDIIFGTFFICRAPDDSEDFTSLTDEQISFYSRLYR